MAGLKEIREALAVNLGSIAGHQISAYQLASPTPPCIQVMGPEEITYDKAMQRGHDEWTLTVMAFTGLASDIGAQKLLDKLIASSGASSIKAALESDKALAGQSQDLRVTKCSGYRVYQLEGRPPLLGAEWTLVVLA